MLLVDCNCSEARCCGKAVGAKPRAVGSAAIQTPHCTLGYRLCPQRQSHYGSQHNTLKNRTSGSNICWDFEVVVTPWHGGGSALTPDAVSTRRAFQAGCATTITVTLSTILVIAIGSEIPGPAGVISGIFARTPIGGTVMPVGVRFPLSLSKRNIPCPAMSTPCMELHS